MPVKIAPDFVFSAFFQIMRNGKNHHRKKKVSLNFFARRRFVSNRRLGLTFMTEAIISQGGASWE